MSLPNKKVDLLIAPVDVKVLPRQRSSGRCGKARFNCQRLNERQRIGGQCGIESQAALRTENLVRALDLRHGGPDLLGNLDAISAANRISMNSMLHLHSRMLRAWLPL